jgi:hypothetical protein
MYLYREEARRCQRIGYLKLKTNEIANIVLTPQRNASINLCTTQ